MRQAFASLHSPRWKCPNVALRSKTHDAVRPGLSFRHQIPSCSRRYALGPSIVQSRPPADEALTRSKPWDGRPPQELVIHSPELDAARIEVAGEGSYASRPVTAQEPKRTSLDRPPQRPSVSLDYRQWNFLQYKPERLAFESDFRSSNDKSLRLVDMPEHANDADLWACLLEFSQRRDGPEGVVSIWRAIQNRASLHEVDGETAKALWSSILDVAVHDEQLLDEVWQHAEWLHTTHGVQWPRIYQTVLSHYISTRHYDNAVRWHLRLSPSFDLGPHEFVIFLQRFILDKDPVIQDILRSIYMASAHHNVYDHVVPFLYARGMSALARSWRRLLILHSEEPTSFSSRAFLLFLSSYYPKEPLTEREKLVAGLEKDQAQGSGIQSMFQLVNRVHGQTFGVAEKGYSDRLGARLFASSWLSLDLAIKVVSIFGVQEIGPLSLQSIASREPQPEDVLRRIEQLEASQISIGMSGFATAVKHFAVAGERETLLDLIESELHPDVFDEVAVQAGAFGSVQSAENWTALRLIVAVRLAISLDTAASISNRILTVALSSGNRVSTLRVLDSMIANGTRTSHLTINAICADMVGHIAPHRGTYCDVDFYLALCHRLTSLNFLPPAEAIQSLIYRLGREKRFDDMERLAFYVLAQYNESRPPSGVTAVNVHESYLPMILRANSPQTPFQVLPPDLHLRHEHHPIQKIFDARLQSSIVRWGFRWGGSEQPRLGPSLSQGIGPPEHFHFARGLRFLALLREKGVLITKTNIRKKTMLRLAELFGPGDNLRGDAELGRRRNQLSLREAKELCDAAYGEEFLPPIAQLRVAMSSSTRPLQRDWPRRHAEGVEV